MPLCDGEIVDAQRYLEHPLVEPFDPTLVQPASYDVRLGTEFRTMRRSSGNRSPWILPSLGEHADYAWDLVEPDPTRPGRRVFVIEPGDFVLAHTLEAVHLPADMVATLEGKSILGRCGLAVHTTAGFIDPGFRGHITLELSVVGVRPVGLEPGMPIAQLVFERLSRPAARPYGHRDLGSHYQGQRGATVPSGAAVPVQAVRA